MAHPKCTRSVENLVMEQQTCGKGPKLGFEYLPTYKTLHCGRTAGKAFPYSANQLRRLVKIFFGAFGAWYFLYFLGQVTVPPQGREGGLQGVEGAPIPNAHPEELSEREGVGRERESC